MGLVLLAELSIFWNHIRQLENVGTAGQMIPAIIGLSALAKVLWSWWKGGGQVGVKDEGGVGVELRECAAVYERLKAAREEGFIGGTAESA